MLLHMSGGQKKRQMKICNFATRMLSIMNEYYGFSVQLSFSAEFRFFFKKHVAFEHFKVKGKCYLLRRAFMSYTSQSHTLRLYLNKEFEIFKWQMVLYVTYFIVSVV